MTPDPKIQRWELEDRETEDGELDIALFPAESGAWVSYEDHLAALKAQRKQVLDEVASLAPHEVRCRCLQGDTFAWQSHIQECPRYEVGSMLAAFQRADHTKTDERSSKEGE